MTAGAPHPYGTICVSCTEPVLTGTESPEHPLQAAMGSSWEVFTFCNDCNSRASKEIDQHFLNEPIILEMRSRHDVRDVRHSGRGRRIPSPLLRGHTDDGMYVVADEDGKPQLRSTRVERGPGEGEFYVTAGSKEELRTVVDELRIKAALEGKTLEEGESVVIEDRPRISGRLKHRPWVLRRAVAKMALAAGSVVYEESWRLSADAARLRSWTHDKDALPWDHCPMEQVAGGPLEFLVEPPHHAIFFRPAKSATLVVIVLFGELVFKLPVDTGGRPIPSTAWYLDPRRPRVNGQTTWAQLLATAARRRFPDEFGGAAA